MRLEVLDHPVAHRADERGRLPHRVGSQRRRCGMGAPSDHLEDDLRRHLARVGVRGQRVEQILDQAGEHQAGPQDLLDQVVGVVEDGVGRSGCRAKAS
jgi:hypothetical protein